MGIHYTVVARTIGAAGAVDGLAMLPALAVALFFREYRETGGFALCAAASLLLAGASFIIARAGSADDKADDKDVKPRDGMFIVFVWWITSVVLGGLPYIACGVLPSPAEALFESASGFTTTGVTVLGGLSELPRSIILWRAGTGWLGGFEIIALSLAVLPIIGAAHAAARPDSAGMPEQMPARDRGGAALLCAFCAGATLLLVLLLAAARVNPFDALILALGTVSTCGFSGGSDEIPEAAGAILCVFMLFASVNFTLYRRMRTSRNNPPHRDEELRCFLLIFCCAAVIIYLDLLLTSESSDKFRIIGNAFFEAASAISTTGFHGAAVFSWPSLCKILLLCLMLTGGCFVSAAGGLKVSRVVILFRLLRRNISVRLHPNAVLPIKFDGRAVPADITSAAAAHGMLFVAVFVAAVMIVSFDGAGNTAGAVFGVLACMSNAGPGMAAVYPGLGPSAWASYGGPAKLFFGFLMILGRLELSSVLILFTPRYWKND
jgi:trk system potassium uptake protein TrkH